MRSPAFSAANEKPRSLGRGLFLGLLALGRYAFTPLTLGARAGWGF